MVAVSDFSGLVSSPWALANAAAMAPMVSLERCMIRLHFHQVKADGAGFRASGAQTAAGGFLGILRHHFLELGLSALVFLMGRTGAAVYGCKFRPCVGPAHVDNADRLQPGPWRLDPEQVRGLASLDTV